MTGPPSGERFVEWFVWCPECRDVHPIRYVNVCPKTAHPLGEVAA